MAMNFLHEIGIIYRGVQLDNILLIAKGHIKVIGCITSVEDINDLHGLMTSFSGISEFLAPEVFFVDNLKPITH